MTRHGNHFHTCRTILDARPDSDRLSDARLQERLTTWRRDTPGCGSLIHLNNAGAALMPRPVVAAIEAYLEKELTLGGYEAAASHSVQIRHAYDLLAGLINATRRNIAIVENATVGVAQALSTWDFKPGDVIVTSRADYPSSQLTYLSLARRLGLVVLRAEDLPEGGVDPQSIAELVRHPRCRLVSLSWVPTNSGLVQPAEEIGRVCEAAGVPYLLDACQAIGQLPVDVAALRCDYLTASARKFLRGPRGIGFLYVSDRALKRGSFPLHLDMRGADWTDPDAFQLAPDARRFENWEFAYALVAGMGAAVTYAQGVGDVGLERGTELAAELRERLRGVPGVRVLDRGRRLCSIVTVELRGWDAEPAMFALRARGINTGASLRTDGVIDMDAKGAASALRMSPHYYNTSTETATMVSAIQDLLHSTPPSRETR